jgi:hypothetical protein
MAMGPETKNYCTGEGQQQFDRLTVLSVVSCTVGSHCLAMTSEQAEDFMCPVAVVISRVCKLARLLQLFVVTSNKHSKHSINPDINPNPMSNH